MNGIDQLKAGLFRQVESFFLYSDFCQIPYVFSEKLEDLSFHNA